VWGCKRRTRLVDKDFLDLTRREFAQQAAGFAASAATNDQAQIARLVVAIGEQANGRVLDVACGPGIVTSALGERAQEVVGVDLTPEMLEKARERCAGRTNVVFRQGSATALPVADETFDAVVTRFSFHHFPDPQVVLKEMLRVLRRGGALAVADIVSSERPEKAELQNALEVLRDPSHVRMLPASELIDLIARTAITIERRETWDQAREFREWLSIVANPERAKPLRTIMRALAAAGEDAGMGLRLDDGAIHFFHRTQLVAGRKN
jgi:ubiquinone/menaquinone biosynthesis C-methylase UbiE